uniref:LIM zinc-binding domain-containing protein n=1 Tax=Trichuris muris TaxID=70415 RepID=A0A5S6QC19_TRIMR
MSDSKKQHLCFACSRKIYGKKEIKVFDESYHPEHFFCHMCNALLTLDDSCHKNEHDILCSKCVANFITKCPGCSQPLRGTVYVALGRRWHWECFRCDQCSKILGSQPFTLVGRLPYCTKCLPPEKKKKKKNK